MDLDNKSKFVEMHQMAVLRQMMEFSRAALSVEINIILNPDFSGHFEGGCSGSFECIGEAVEIVKSNIKKIVVKTIDQMNKDLVASIENTKQIADRREKWKELGHDVMAGKYTIPE
jgi:hypothetical protein